MSESLAFFGAILFILLYSIACQLDPMQLACRMHINISFILVLLSGKRKIYLRNGHEYSSPLSLSLFFTDDETFLKNSGSRLIPSDRRSGWSRVRM